MLNRFPWHVLEISFVLHFFVCIRERERVSMKIIAELRVFIAVLKTFSKQSISSDWKNAHQRLLLDNSLLFSTPRRRFCFEKLIRALFNVNWLICIFAAFPPRFSEAAFNCKTWTFQPHFPISRHNKSNFSCEFFFETYFVKFY